MEFNTKVISFEFDLKEQGVIKFICSELKPKNLKCGETNTWT